MGDAHLLVIRAVSGRFTAGLHTHTHTHTHTHMYIYIN